MKRTLLAGGFGADVVEDACQETALLLLGGGPTKSALLGYRGRSSLEAWTKTIGFRLAAAASKRRPTLSHDEALRLAGEIVATPRTQRELIHRELRPTLNHALAMALQQISLFDRELIVAVFAHQTSIRVLATTHGVDRGTVARWIGRAQHQLQLRLKPLLQSILSETEQVSSVLRCFESSMGLAAPAPAGRATLPAKPAFMTGLAAWRDRADAACPADEALAAFGEAAEPAQVEPAVALHVATCATCSALVACLRAATPATPVPPSELAVAQGGDSISELHFDRPRRRRRHGRRLHRV